MATKKTTTKKPIAQPTEQEEIKKVKVEPKKQIPKLGDDILVNVKSNTYGELIYIDHKTGDRTSWDNFGDIQTLTIGSLRNMKAGNRGFYTDNCIVIDSIEDNEFQDIEIEEVYNQLQVLQYYKESLCPTNINEVFNWKPDEIKDKVPLMSKGTRSNLVVAANELISKGVLDSITKIKALESVLGCELTVKD